jgi:viroplasmin and RNaseH domain-containing protein
LSVEVKKKWYVVLRGKVSGVYDDLDDCLVQVNEFPSNSYKGYKTKEEAEARYNKHLSKKEECGRMNTKEEETMLMTILFIPFFLVVIAVVLYLIAT